MTSGIEPATYRLVVQCLNQLRQSSLCHRMGRYCHYIQEQLISLENFHFNIYNTIGAVFLDVIFNTPCLRVFFCCFLLYVLLFSCFLCNWPYDRCNILLLLLLLLLLPSLSPLCRVSIHISLRQTMSLGDTLLKPFYLCCLWCLYL